MAYDQGLAERMRDCLSSTAAITEKKMFGGLAFIHRGYMFCGIVGSELMARVGPEAHAACLALPHVRPMDFTGKPMRGYVFVGVEGIETDETLRLWMERTMRFVETLPDKTGG
ncbi:MAG: TfoX/Sxy family protein [Rhodothermales bacterium]|nr:TfoX/Sxy family protein [Rhodothermales bacterium]